MQSWHVIPLNESHSEQCLSLVIDHFCRQSTLHTAANVSSKELREYLSKHWYRYACEGPIESLVAVSDDGTEALGCVIARRFPTLIGSINNLPEKQKPITALLQALEAQFLEQSESSARSVLVDLAVVKESATRLGIYQNLRSVMHQRAAEAGYEKIYGQLTSVATQHVCVKKLEHKVVSEIRYQDFSYNGTRPFASIESPRSIQLVEGCLTRTTGSDYNKQEANKKRAANTALN